MTQLTRRDFLRVAGALAAGAIASKPLGSLGITDHKKPNIIIVLCDSLSAMHLSLHGYRRRTTPNIDSFAERSTVFHTHYSGGNFTTTGTASMLTGMLAWKHRAINYGGLVRPDYARKNPYTLLGSEYYRIAFSQNRWPERMIGQYRDDVDRFLPSRTYSTLIDNPASGIFHNDQALTSIAIDDFLLPAPGNVVPGSAVFGYMHKSLSLASVEETKSLRYPEGSPVITGPGYMIPFLNETVYAGIYSELSRLTTENSPYFAYFHLYSPHLPYRPRKDYQSLFREDGYVPAAKPTHPFALDLDDDYIGSERLAYDQQIAQMDDEFGRLVRRLEQLGVLEDSYLILTSDHGELFERGFVGHGAQLMYEPVLRIPLLIHAPAQSERSDIYALTSNIDLLPTILSIAGKEQDPEMDGKILPGFAGQVERDRTIISMVAIDNPAFRPIEKAVIVLRKGAYKLIAYLGYDEMDRVFELYDLESDPDELDDLALKDIPVLASLKNECLEYLHQANQLILKRQKQP